MKSTSRMFKALLGGILLLVFALAGQAAAQTWQQLFPAVPPAARIFHSAVYNTAANQMIVFGGVNSTGCIFAGGELNDVWVLGNADGLGGPPTWTLLAPTGGPPAR